ncbi:MAG: FecR domain-containing protein [Candidatus Pseudobacter hemicellulosilyticus]|uniref:FecR domain-containing protein n=1 Tax=Candidatus Pseudobacter hemicellulosilyticus TaxID=3121375 RepID=A0AAJ5WRT3_9BACT|nr:MAG: FecR domain-containing protein [Pseudobacter sp.]
MERIEYLIRKFWEGNTANQERKELFALLKENEAAFQAFLESQYRNNAQLPVELLDSATSTTILSQLHAQIGQQQQAKVIKLRKLRWVAAAAVLIMVSVAGFRYLVPQGNAPIAEIKPTAAIRLLTQSSNAGTAPQQLHLQDGSVVTLYPGSTISYYTPFDSTDRNIQLQGNAYFKVAKSKNHPFAVTAGECTTTALGTEFLVSTRSDSTISIKLIEGRVVVRPKATKAANPGNTTDVATNANTASELNVTQPAFPGETYLQAGEELVMNFASKQQKLLTPVLAKAAPKKDVPVQPKTEETASTNGLEFNRAPLQQIFDQLSKQYHINIQYNPEEIQSLTFSGSFRSTDSYQKMLKLICTMNDLSLTEQDGKMLIQRKP